MGPHDIKPYFNKQQMEDEFDRIAATQDRFGIIETWHRCKNNDIYPVEVRLRVTEAEGHSIVVAIARDMTLRYQHEQALRLSEEKFRRLFESSPIGLVLADQSFAITEVNPSFCNMLGYLRDELIGKTFNEITYPDDQHISTEYAQKLFAGNVTAHAREKRYIHKNGEIVWTKLNNTIVCDTNQRPLYALGMIENISHIKQAEALRLAHEAAQKKALVREVHHRIKNHLQGVVGLMQQHAINSNLCGSVIELAISQINAVATIHGLQSKTSAGNIHLLEMLEAINHGLKQAYPSYMPSTIRVAGNCSPQLDHDDSVPIALALNELMINACKHGIGAMQISLVCNPDHAIIHIENQCKPEFVQPNAGSGLVLVKALVQTDGATFRYEYANQRFLAEIALTPPVIQIH
jgi:PAS domain S-box-containing protein